MKQKLTKDTRLFTAKGALLANTGKILLAGTEVVVLKAATMHYDHRSVHATAIEYQGDERWVINREAFDSMPVQGDWLPAEGGDTLLGPRRNCSSND